MPGIGFFRKYKNIANLLHWSFYAILVFLDQAYHNHLALQH